MIYLDYAATSPLSQAACDAMREALSVFGNPSSAHAAGSMAKSLLQESRETVADCLHCLPGELIFTSGGTESNALALHGRKNAFYSATEHSSVSGNLPDGRVLPVGRDGVLSIDTAKELLKADAAFVSVQYANNELGVLQPIADLGAFCRERQILFHTDAVQAVGHVPIDLQAEQIDLLSLSAHKFGGPKGIGALYCRTGVPLVPLWHGGAQERGNRAGTESVLLAVGMAAALREAVAGMERETKRLSALRAELETALTAMGGVITAKGARRLAGHIHVCFPGQDAEAMLYALDLQGICVSAGAACHSASRKASDVLLAIGMTEQDAAGCLRITLGSRTTREEILAFAHSMHEITKKEKQ